jgi:hypothetical protein
MKVNIDGSHVAQTGETRAGAINYFRASPRVPKTHVQKLVLGMNRKNTSPTVA